MVALSVLLGFLMLLIIDYFVLRAEKKLHPAFIKNYKIIDSVAFNNLSVTSSCRYFYIERPYLGRARQKWIYKGWC